MTASTGCLTRGTENRASRGNAALPLTLNYTDTVRAKTPLATWPTRLMVLAQPAPRECGQTYDLLKAPINILTKTVPCMS